MTVTEQLPAVGRRQLLGTSISAAGVIALSACGNSQPKAGPAQRTPRRGSARQLPPEDLMREHGVLRKRIFVQSIEKESAASRSAIQAPAQALNASAGIIRSFIEDYHEHLEEQYVFPKLEQAAKLTDLTTVLRIQHQHGRVLTDRVFGCHRRSGSVRISLREKTLMQDMSAFIRMYEPHEAREDTVVFPALRDVVPAVQFRDMAETFEDEEHRRFGQTGFQGVVDKVADIEKSLGIYDLSQFTPSQ